jgi:amino acid adenylation domain-containing protein
MKFPFQVVNEQPSFAWDEVNLNSLPSSGQQRAIFELLSDSSKLNLTDGPVLHARWVTLSAERSALLISTYALCADNASLHHFCAEFGKLCAGESISGDVLQYADFSEWQNEIVSSRDGQAEEAGQYWNATEFDALPPLNIPFQRQANSGAAVMRSVPLNLTAAVVQESPEFLFGAWQGFLARICGRPEFVLGFVSEARNHEEFAGGIGVFSRTLPIRISVEGEPTFASFLKARTTALAQALEYQDYFSCDRIAGRLPIGFLSFTEVSARNCGSVRISESARIVPSPAFCLELRCAQTSDGIKASLLYDRECFPDDIITTLAERFAVYLSAAGNSDSLLTAAPIMSAAERKAILVEFNQTAAPYASEKCIHQLFEEQAELHPDRPALRFGGRAFTYAELNREANRIANVLLASGVKGNVPVALCLERSAEMIIALLGVLKAGACYVPLVPENPKPRLAHQLAETGAPVVLTEQKYLPNLPEFSGRVICLDRDRSLLDKMATSNPGLTVSPDDLVYVIYTSGSTGTPKGVAVRHFNLVNYSQFICRRLKVEEHPNGLSFATVSTISADLGNTCIFPSLISGGCLHVISYETAMSPAEFAAYNRQQPIDVLKITPSHLSSLLNTESPDATLPRTYLILGGEATRWDLVERIRRANKCALLNHYGPTEATVGCCTFPAETDVSHWNPSTLPIGKPVANDQIYILDPRMEPVPAGVAGEIFVGGTGLARGYFNQPEQTSERFIRNPFSSDPAARLYRTGDLARFLPDGNIEFLGRIDAQVKIRGFRVEPAEIEAMLRRHPAVSEAAIVPYEKETGEKQLAAYFVAPSKPENRNLRAFLLEQLPEYMVPSAFLPVASLPITPNGKLDVRALPAPGQEAPVHESVAPRTPDEEKLAAIWREVLKRDQIGVSDNFFELGGHSLLATQIISRIRNIFRVQMPLHAFLQNPTIAALAENIPGCPPVESEQEEMARLLKELDGISDEEAERLLSADTLKEGSVKR